MTPEERGYIEGLLDPFSKKRNTIFRQVFNEGIDKGEAYLRGLLRGIILGFLCCMRVNKILEAKSKEDFTTKINEAKISEDDVIQIDKIIDRRIKDILFEL